MLKFIGDEPEITKNKVADDNGLYELRLEPVYCKFYNAESNYGIYTCNDLDTEKIEQGFFEDESVCYNQVTIVGNMPRLITGKNYACKAEHIFNDTYGEQFKVRSIYSNQNNTFEDEQCLLRELVTESIFLNIVAIYPAPITAIMSDEFDYSLIKGIKEKKYEQLKAKVIESQRYIKALAELGKYGLSYNVIVTLVENYGSSEVAIEKVLNNPYVLYKEVNGIGFKKADYIAKTLGFKDECPERKHAGIIYVLELNEYAGNTWMHKEILKSKVIQKLMIPFNDIDAHLEDKTFFVDDKRVAMNKLKYCEERIADEIERINEYDRNLIFVDSEVSKRIEAIEESLGISYTVKQKELFHTVNKHNFVVLTGFAGTGKTTLLNGCLRMLADSDWDIEMLLVSPTAKAAKVLSKATSREALTIHRALKWQNFKFVHNRENKLRCDVLVIDEASMVDIFLFYSLLKAVPDDCIVIMVGDTAQLESIAVGNVLNDVINSGYVPVIALTDVFRQALDSGTLYAATEVRNGRKFYTYQDEILELGVKKDCKVWFSEKEAIPDRLMILYKLALGKWSIDDMLVISPMKKGLSGVINLNKVLQAIANPAEEGKREVVLERCIFRVGDKVKHTKNDYNAVWYDEYYNVIPYSAGVFNGEFGVIKYITNDKHIYVDYGDKLILYKKPYEKLDLAYAITCHSAQGSQSKVIMGVLDMSHYLNLKRNLVYTLMTRAESKLFLIVEQKAIGMAISNNTIEVKQTFLEEFLTNKK